jgi:hypothetical protein
MAENKAADEQRQNGHAERISQHIVVDDSAPAGAANPLPAVRPAGQQQKRVIGRPFPKGVSGNPKGRPKGCRDKINERFLKLIYAALKGEGKEAIAEVLEKRPQDFLKIVAGLQPAHVAGPGDEPLAQAAATVLLTIKGDGDKD